MIAAFRTLFVSSNVRADSGYRPVMGTIAHIVVVAPDKKTAKMAVEAAFERLEYVDAVMSNYKNDSELSIVNRSAFERNVKVCDDLFRVIAESVRYSDITDGAFDITVGPVLDLWRKAESENRRPEPAEIEKAKRSVGYEKLILDDSKKTVRFAVEGMRLDLGGVAKGYAVDLATEAARQGGATAVMVDVGGDIGCFGGAGLPEKSWRIGLQNPQQDDNVLLKLRLDNQAIATSGDYRRFILIDGRRYSHIIEPATGASAEKFSSVTIIAPSAMQADIIATAVSVMSPEDGKRLVASIDGVEAIVIGAAEGSETTITDGTLKYIEQPHH